MHRGCWKWITIEQTVAQPSGSVVVRCKHCQTARVSIQEWGLKKVKEVIDLCDSE
ncbi:hypothetical protein CHLRE_09g397701v5 [Chlamydomonas reinhardtii]|uniref:Uncharacterized protein n=1 Tax=Chlamydomonas reinhardtii TaxID=3055 RepID=A0A2K3DD20_CHLRE|nr:uncharacterized protein CHLRE_09g397701v5 [Chlamydomonas reinhardtii]PNW78432.1 hypothetical protein CHLRE_09g397701v5 [Chlamydomonas reinhardtii]